jgi:hypothetical protein
MTLAEARLALLREVDRQGAVKAGRSQFTERFRGVLAAREERAMADLYAGLRGIGLPLPELTDTLYDVTLSGRSRQSCTVSLPAQDPDAYDLVLVGPKGLSAPARVAPERCRWLARFGPAQVVNPALHAGTAALALPPPTAPDIKLLKP